MEILKHIFIGEIVCGSVESGNKCGDIKHNKDRNKWGNRKKKRRADIACEVETEFHYNI